MVTCEQPPQRGVGTDGFLRSTLQNPVLPRQRSQPSYQPTAAQHAPGLWVTTNDKVSGLVVCASQKFLPPGVPTKKIINYLCTPHTHPHPIP